MEKIDVEKLKVAMKYISRMEAGNNPINNQKLSDDSFVHNPNVVRCLAFVEDVLTKVCDNQGYIGRIPKRVRDDMNLYRRSIRRQQCQLKKEMILESALK